MTLVEQYLEGLKQAYIDNGGEEVWQKLMDTAHGASDADLQARRNRYPQVPESLLDLLLHIDGSYCRFRLNRLWKLKMKPLIFMLITSMESMRFLLMSALLVMLLSFIIGCIFRIV